MSLEVPRECRNILDTRSPKPCGDGGRSSYFSAASGDRPAWAGAAALKFRVAKAFLNMEGSSSSGGRSGSGVNATTVVLSFKRVDPML